MQALPRPIPGAPGYSQSGEFLVDDATGEYQKGTLVSAPPYVFDRVDGLYVVRPNARGPQSVKVGAKTYSVGGADAWEGQGFPDLGRRGPQRAGGQKKPKPPPRARRPADKTTRFPSTFEEQHTFIEGTQMNFKHRRHPRGDMRFTLYTGNISQVDGRLNPGLASNFTLNGIEYDVIIEADAIVVEERSAL